MNILKQPYPFNNGVVSTENSSTVSLGIGGVFAGAWIDTLEYSEVTITVKSDKSGSLAIQKSSTGLSIGTTATYPYTSVGVGLKIGLGTGGRYIRIVYTNGAVAQTTFSLNTYFHINPTGFSFQQIDEPQISNTYALNTLSVISGKSLYDGTHGVVPLAKDLSLMTTSTPYIFSIAEGDVPNHTIQHKMGYTNASTAAETTLWNPGTQYVFAAGTISVEAVSTSANDTSAGSGVRTVHLQYLDINYAEKTFTFTINGVTPVAGPTDFFRVNGFHVETAGATGKTEGVVSLRLVGGAATVYSQMAIGTTRSRNSVFTVPAGKTYYVENVHFSAGYKTTGKTVRMTLHASINPDGVTSTSGTIFWPYFESMLIDGTSYDPSDAPLKFLEKTDIKVSVIGETLAQCTSRISGWIEFN